MRFANPQNDLERLLNKVEPNEIRSNLIVLYQRERDREVEQLRRNGLVWGLACGVAWVFALATLWSAK